ncbi:MAG TPA: PEPxxWA-CTERM sorting domain-containing protein [Sphingobium sp.]|nr:PEPxxWA-CTERM sorting domain-containing protein [Sphingobium sp.]
MLRTFFVATALALSGQAMATPVVSGTFTFNVDYQYDFASQSVEPLPFPSNQTIQFSIPLTVDSVYDYSAYTNTYFGAQGDTSVFSSLDAYSFPKDPLAFSSNAFAYVTTGDFPSNYVTDFGLRAGQQIWNGNGFSYLDTELHVVKLDAPRSGLGVDDVAYTASGLVDFLTDFQANPQNYRAWATKSWGDFTYVDPPVYVSYSDGKYWSIDGNSIRLTLASAVPEPATWTIMLVGFGAIGCVLRTRKKQSASAFA